MQEHPRITDVSPRDGLQNEPGVIPTADKARLVELLAACGLDEIEVSSFVSPRWVPQLGDAAQLFAAIPTPPVGTIYSALVPNDKGLEAALEVNRASREARGTPLISKVSLFTAASETFAQRNTNASIAQTLERFAPVITRAHENGLRVRAYISCVIACPFEGPISPAAVAAVIEPLLALGADEIDLGDTIGAATVPTLRDLLAHAARLVPITDPLAFTLHLHDTLGTAAACVREALDLGVRSFDGSAGGLGGCPYASTPGRRAPGNIATQTLVRTIREAGLTPRVDANALDRAGEFAQSLVGR
jgi:hydroxymethylglutaryl-CoA lyase